MGKPVQLGFTFDDPEPPPPMQWSLVMCIKRDLQTLAEGPEFYGGEEGKAFYERRIEAYRIDAMRLG